MQFHIYPSGGAMVGHSIIKLDLEKKKFVGKWKDDECYTTEPLFVPMPGSVKEDDGVVVMTCLHPKKSSSLVVLSPDLKELGRVTFKDVVTPVTFHGAWVD